MSRLLKWIGIVLLTLISLFVIALIWNAFQPPSQPAWGITFSPRYARFLGLDAGEAYHWMLGDLGVKKLRFPLYWDEIEKDPGVYDFRDADWYLWDADKRGLSVTLVIGERSPRWPECHAPNWLSDNKKKQDEALLTYLEKTVDHFKNNTAVVRWQIENEPLFSMFGVCSKPDRARLEAEIALVRRLDPRREIQLTGSGELEPWLPLARRADILGVSVYRKSWNKTFGDVYYPLSPAFYRLRTWFVRPWMKQVIVSELQAEPWFPDVAMAHDPKDGQSRFTADDLRANAAFAADAGFTEVYFWGAEWWYFMKTHGSPEVWEAAKKIFKENR